MNNNIYNMVSNLAASRHNDGGQSALRLLFGFARLATMNDGVLNAMFSQENDRNEIKKIREALEENDLDLELIKTCVATMSDEEIIRED